MKKVVLLAGALAAGMVVAPQAANAAAPKAPISPTINDLDGINATPDLTVAGITQLIADWQDMLDETKAFMLTPSYAEADQDVKDKYDQIVADIEWNMLECHKVIDTSSNNATPGTPYNDNCSLFNEVDGVGDDQSKLGLCRSIEHANISQIKPYWPEGGPKVGETTIYDVFWGLKKAINKANEDVVKSSIKNANKVTADNVEATPEYGHLKDLLNEANEILDGTDPLYKDAATFDELKDKEFDAHLKDGAMVSAKNLIDKINGARDVDTELVSEYELMVDLSTVTPELEGLLSTFKKHANEEAAKKIQNYIDTKFNGGTIDALIEGLQHHLDTKATCFDAANHVIANNADVVADKTALATTLGALEPDAAWNALGHDDTDPANDRVLSDPAAVKMWYDIQQGNTNAIDNDLTNLETAVYTACLTYDSEDIKAALDELAGTGYTADLEGDVTRVNHVAVATDLKDWLTTHLTDTSAAESLAKQWFDLDDDFTNNLFMGDISAAAFATAEAAVDKLEKTIANVKANWADIVKLNDATVELLVDIETAKEKEGYDSSYIEDKWQNATNGEKRHYDILVGEIENKIKQITDAPATDTTNAGNWIGANVWDNTFKSENDHHDWLAQYQQENYDAKESLLDAIEVRFAEYQKVAGFAITSDDPENPMALADGTELYTTDTNKGVSLIDILGEETTTKLIYKDAFFNELMEHFGNNDGTVDAASIVTDGKPVDLMDDLIKDWYDKGDAQYIGEKNYVDDKWNEAERKGELKNNTVEGLQVTTSATDASGILVFAPEATTAGNEVVFGWLQKEIQNAFAKAVENEKANKDLHDQIDACEEYVQDAKDDIDNYAKFVLSHLKQDIEVYDIWSRETTTNTRGDLNWNLDILYPGTTSGVPSLDPVALPAEYKTKEDATVITLAAGAHDYNNDFDCGHESGVWGWTKIATEISALWDKEKAEYDKVASKALLDSKYVEEKITEIEENVDDIKNEAYTRIIKNGFARVHNSINEARAWAAGIDGVCHEDGLKPCDADDIKNNPCGWDDPEASKALADLIDFYNEKLTLLGTEHNGEANDDHDTPVVDEDNIVEFAGYLNQMYKDLNAWTVKFAAADMKHKKALNAALDLAESEAHTVHHYSFDAKSAKVNFSADGADAAAADVWAADFNARIIGTYDGEEVTFQQFVKKIDDKMVAEYSYIHAMDPDKYAAIKAVATNGITCFNDYVTGTEYLETFLEVVANVYYNHHQYTELKKLAEGIKNFNWEADFNKKLEANKDAKVEFVQTLGDLQAEVNAIEILAAELYDATYIGTVANTKYADLDGLRETINTDIDTLLGTVNTEYLAGKCDAYAFNASGITTKITELKNALEAAKKLYAENKAALDKFTEELKTVTATKLGIDTVLENADVYEGTDADTAADLTKKGIVKAAADAYNTLYTAETAATHLPLDFAKGELKAKEGEHDAHILALTGAAKAYEDAVLKAIKFHADNVEAYDRLYAQLAAVNETRTALDTEWEAVKDHVYEVTGHKDQTEVETAIAALATVNALSTKLTEELGAGTILANEETLGDQIAALTNGIANVRALIAEKVKFFEAEQTTAADLRKQVDDLEVLQQSLDTTWAVYDDIDNDKDAAALNAAYKAVTEAIAAERGAIAADLTAGNVQAHAEDYVVGGETVKGHNTVIGDINSAIKDIQDNVREYEKFYADEHALADKYNDELNNLETLRDALGTVWDAYDTLDDSDKTLTALHADWQAITEDIAAERTAIADDLEAGHVQAHAADYEEAGETVKGHETVLSDIADAIKTLQDKVRDIEEYKATNEKNYVTLREAISDLLASLDDVKYVSDDVYELLPATEAAADLDQESIEAAREAAKTLANTELTALETALATGKLYTDAEVAAQQAKIDEVTDALEALKEQVKAAEDFRRANAEANDKLEEKVQALVTIINTAKANSVCDLCNEEDTADLEAELDAVYEILGNVAESFAVGHLAMPTAADNYAKYMQDLGAVEANVQTTLDEIAEHKVRQINDQNAYNVLQKALTDVDLWLANVELEEGWENFAVRTDHCSNPDVKYLNELTTDVNDLKALIETQHSHAGGHVCEENKIDDMKQMKVLIEDAKTLIAAIQANEAAKVILDAQFEEVAGLVNDALEFWEDNYMDKTLVQLEDIIAYWTGTPAGEKGKVQEMYDLIQDKYQHGAAAYDWTVDAKGEEFKQDVIDDVEKQKQDIEMHRNTAANYEAINHMDEVEAAIDALVAEVKADVTEGDMVDPFVKELYADFLALVGEYAVDNEGLYGVLAQIDAARNENYLAGTLEDAINIDERSKIKGIHQMLNELKQNAETLVATYNDLFEHAHHLTNGKTLYSDMQYVTIGFFRQANEGLGEQATEMFKEVKLDFDPVEGNIGIYDTNWLNVLDWEDVNDTPDNMFDDVPAAYERDFAGHLVHQDGLGEIPAKVGVLGHGDKKNELTFTLNDEQDYVNAEIRTLAAGAADITFKPGSLTVDGWTTKHNVYIEVNVEKPQEEVAETDVITGSNKLIVRLDNPIDLTYTINSLVARTNDGTEFSYADRVINYAANTLEFNLPEGTTSVELPEGFFTFRTGENTIARSAAMVVTVGGTTTIEGLIAMGEKAQIFDLQGRRVKAEALISGNTYVVNGEKVMVK